MELTEIILICICTALVSCFITKCYFYNINKIRNSQLKQKITKQNNKVIPLNDHIDYTNSTDTQLDIRICENV